MTTTFSISGLRATKDGYTHATITWTDGALSGDENAVAAVERLAEEYADRPLRPVVGPISDGDHLANPYTACLLMRSVFKPGSVTQVGSLPKIDLPPGAIA